MLTVIQTIGKRKVDNKDVMFPRQKIITGFCTLKNEDKVIQGGKADEKGNVEAGYPTFAELVPFYGGQTEYPAVKDGANKGKILDSDCLVKHAVAGWNQNESNSAFGRSPAQAEAQADSAFDKLAKSKGWSVEKKAEMRELLEL